jgi:hypothetical protein
VSLLRDFQIISIVGNAKNAGKTTVMNSYLDYLTEPIAITSIGLDGEEIDQVTFMNKPQIYVKPGYFVATAEDTLKNFTCEYEIIRRTKLSTSIGMVVIVEVKSIGKVLVAGPAKVSDMEILITELKQIPISKIIIDGAFSRHVFARLSQATLLVIGANKSRDMNIVVNSAKLLVQKFKLSSNPYKDICFGEKITFIDKEHILREWRYSSIIGKVHDFFNEPFDGIKAVYFPKALTNSFVEKLIRERNKYKFDIILDSPTSVQINDSLLEKILKLDNKLYVVNPINLVAVFCNPYSPAGYEFNDKDFKKSLSEVTNFDVVNVLKDGAYE